MNHQEGFFKGVHGIRIYHQCWLPESEPKAVLMIVHGLGEHSGRYLNLVNHFVPMGFAVYGMDHPGHGKSDGARKYVDRFEDFIGNVKAYFDRIQDWQAGKPVFLVGHSMGGLISAVYLLDHQAGLKGAIISGPSVKIPGNVSPATVFIGKMLATLMPKLGLLKTAPEGVSRNPAVVQAYMDDPLVYKGKTTVRLAAEMLKAMQRVSSEAAKITLPILILQGGADWIVDPAGAGMLFDLVSSADKEIKIYDGLFHEVYNEPEHPQVLRDVELWIEVRVK
jgi:acylglycerol lipase